MRVVQAEGSLDRDGPAKINQLLNDTLDEILPTYRFSEDTSA